MAEIFDPGEPAPGLGVPELLRAAAGVAVTGEVRITNTAAEPRVMSLSLHGVDAAWLPTPSRSEVLAPGASVTAEVVLHPAVGTIAARYPIAVAVQALDPRTGQAAGPTALAEIVLVVDAPGQIAVELEPAEARAVFGKRIQIRLRNDGTLPAYVDLQTQAPSSARVSLRQQRVEVPPAATVTVRGRIRPRRVHLFGHRARHAYTVTGRSAGAPRHVEGVLTTRAVLGPNATKAAALLAVVAVWVALAIVFVPKLADWARPGSTQRQAAGPTKTAPTGSGAPGAPGSGGPSAPAPGGSGGSGGSGSGGAGGAAAHTVQLNGTVGGTSPGGVTVSMQPTSLVDEAAEGAIPVGVSTASQAVGKIPAEALTARSAPVDGQVRTVTTTADGAWSFPAVPKPGYYLLSFAKPGFQTVRYIIDSTTADATEPLNVTLSAGQGQLSGAVNGPGGRVGGAQVTITDGTNTVTTSTDSTGDVGSWSVVGLSTPGSYLVSASKDGLGTESRLVTLGAGGTSNVSLTLRAGVGTVAGSVQSSAGEALGGVTVSATDGTLIRSATTVTEAGLRGRYTLSGLSAPGKYTVTFSAQGYLQQTVQVSLGAGQSQATADVTLFPSTATVVGSLTGGGSAAGPLVGAGLTLTSPQQTYKTTSGGDGSYRFDGIAPGSYVLSAEYAGLATVFKTVTVSAGSTKPIVLPGFELAELPNAVSDASIVGFVSDGVNPSNTLCAGLAPGKCSVTLTLTAPRADPTDSKNWLAHESVNPAQSGPTSYSVTPGSGVEPGLYRLTIDVTDYLPVTVDVQLPLHGIATAPPAILFPANTIVGTVRATGDLGADGSGTAVTNCVYVVPAGGAKPDLSSCDESKLPASQCQTTGDPGPGYADIEADNTFRVTGLCDGSYDLYVGIINPWYVPRSSKVATVVVAHGQSVPIAVDIQRKGQLALTMAQINQGSQATERLPAGTVVTLSECVSLASWPNPAPVSWSPQSVTVGAGDAVTTRYVIGGFDPGWWYCNAKVTSTSGYSATQTNWLWLSYDQTSTAGLVFTKTIGTVFGQLTTSWSGQPVGVAGGTVTISGITGYVDQQPVVSSVQVTPDAKGCFAITPDGAAPDTATATGDCKNDTGLTGGAVGKLGLVVNSANVHVDPPPGYLAPADLLNHPVDSGTAIAISLNPTPVALTGLTLKPTDVADLGKLSVQVTGKPAGAGSITLSVNTSDGSIGWQDSGLAAGQAAPGTYTLVASGSGYVTTPYTFTCNVNATCDRSGTPLAIDKLGSLTVTMTSDGTAPVNDVIATLLLDGQALGASASSGTGNTVTFNDLTPNVDLPGTSSGYAIRVQAAGYQFGDSTGSKPLVSLDCGGAASISITPGAGTSCTATLTRDGAITGTVQGVLAKSPATSPNQLLSGASVSVGTLDAGNNFTPAFTTTTAPDGTFRLTGSKTKQGLDAGSWTLQISYPGYTTLTQSVNVTANSDKALGTIHLYVTPVTFVVTVKDQNGDPATGLTATLLPNTVGTEGSPADGIYTFADVIPGSYTLELTKAGFVTTTTQVQITVGKANQTFTTYVSQAANRVSGTVTAKQGKAGLTTALSGATVCVVIAATDDCTKAITGTDKQPVRMSTGADGAFSFGNVPNTLLGGKYYARAEPPYGWLPAVSSGFTVYYPGAGMTGLSLVPQQVTNQLTVTVSTGATLTSQGATLTNASDATWTYSLTAPSSTGTGSYGYVFNQVPTGCWTFTFDSPPDSLGQPTATTLPTDSTLGCAADAIAMPGTVQAGGVAASYDLPVGTLKLTVQATPSGTDTAPAALHLVITSGTTTLYEKSDLASGDPVQLVLRAGPSYSLTLAPSDTRTTDEQLQWPTVTQSGITLSKDATKDLGTVSVIEMSKVEVTVTNATATPSTTLTVTAGGGNSYPVPTPYASGLTVTDATAQIFWLPAATWKFAATDGTLKDNGSVTVTVAGPNTLSLTLK